MLNAGKIGVIIDLSENNDTKVSEEIAALLGEFFQREKESTLFD